MFVPGRIAGFTNPVHITASQTATLESNFIQRLGAYECPVIVIHDPASKKTHHVLFGGISHFFYHQTGQHQSVYYWVTRDGRNDGLPYTEDISVITRSADGSSHEWILPFPIPARGYPPPRPWPDPIISYNPAEPFISNLRGASTHFIPNAKLIGSRLDSSGVVLFDQIDPGEEIVIGHIYGGIEARYPLPVFTGTGSKAGNAMYEVIFAKIPSPAIDASLATEAIGTLDTQSKLENRANSSAPTTTRPQN